MTENIIKENQTKKTGGKDDKIFIEGKVNQLYN